MLIEAAGLAAVLILLSEKKAQASGPCGVYGQPGLHFTWSQLTVHSSTPNLPNTPTTAACSNLKRLATEILDPLVEFTGAPIIVNSAYRSTQVNAAVGGVVNSRHLQGKAADIRSDKFTPSQLEGIVNARGISHRYMKAYATHLHIDLA